MRGEAAGAGGGARPGDDVTWSEWRAAWNASRDPGFRRWRAPALAPHGTGGLGGRRGGVNAWSASAPYSAPLSPPRELHVAPPPLAQTIARPAGLPRRTKLMVRSAPPTKRPPTDWRVSGLLCQTSYTERGLGFHPQNLGRVGGVVFSSDPALRPRPGPSLHPGLIARKPASLCLRTWQKLSSSALRP
ncbi:LOW QUALITY PROTEIN: uncharacterized protein C19orf73 homolog [Dama dama]